MKKLDTANWVRVAIVLLLIALGIWSRFAPHPANFTALTAVALFGGAMLPRYYGLLVPVGAMVISDMFIGMHSLSVVVWISFALVALLGQLLSKRFGVKRVVVASVVSSTMFFIITNFAVWAEGRLYAHTFADLVQCYINALPFYRTMLLGDLLYSGAIFGVYAVVVRLVGLKPKWSFLHN